MCARVKPLPAPRVLPVTSEDMVASLALLHRGVVKNMLDAYVARWRHTGEPMETALMRLATHGDMTTLVLTRAWDLATLRETGRNAVEV